MATVLTFGHGTASREQLSALLEEAGVRLVVDVRRFPGSRRHPHVARDAMAVWLPAAGVDYRWEQALGGRRRLPADAAKDAGGSDDWWRVAAFRAYAAHTRTDEFGAALERLMAAEPSGRPATAASSRSRAAPNSSVRVWAA